MGVDDKEILGDMLLERILGSFLFKKEKYRGKIIVVYLLGNNDFLVVYSEVGFYVVSYQKSLIEKVIDVCEDEEKVLSNDFVFVKVMQKKKMYNFLILYGCILFMFFLQDNSGCWSEFDFYMNSDVVYFIGDIFMFDLCGCVNQMVKKLKNILDIREDSLIIFVDKDFMVNYMEEVYERNSRILFNECVVNFLCDVVFMFVVDMNKIFCNLECFEFYLLVFLLENVFLFYLFIFLI